MVVFEKIERYLGDPHQKKNVLRRWAETAEKQEAYGLLIQRVEKTKNWDEKKNKLFLLD